MAKINNGYMGAFNGKLGTAIAYQWKGRNCLRAYNPKPRNPRTERQQNGRLVFGIVSHLASVMKSATTIGLRSVAEEQNSLRTNIFVSLNRQCVRVENDTVIIDYPSIRISDGTLAGVEFGSLHKEEPMTVGVDFTSANTYNGSKVDQIYMFAYSEGIPWVEATFPVARHTGHISKTLPGNWAGREVHFYGFCWSKYSQTASPSSYIGKTLMT